MSPDEALVEIRGLAKANRLDFSDHAIGQMWKRKANKHDVHFALTTATRCVEEEREKWKVPSHDMDGDELTVIVVIEDGLQVVTVF